MTETTTSHELTILTAHRPGEPTLLEHASLDAPEWLDEQLKAKNLITQRTPISEFTPYIWEKRNLHKHLSYGDWQQLADLMPEMASTVTSTMTFGTQNPEGEPDALLDILEHHTPPDLPPVIAEQRLEHVVDALPDPRLSDTKKELLEIILASKHARPVNLARFRPDSLKAPSWSRMTRDLDMGDLMEGGRAAQAELKQVINDIERTAQTNHKKASINQRRERLNLDQELRETDYLIDLCYEQTMNQINQEHQDTQTMSLSPTVLQNALDASMHQDPEGQTPVLVTYTGLNRQQIDTVIINPNADHMKMVHDPERAADITTLAEFGQNLWRHPAVHNTMTYTHWARLSEFLKPHTQTNMIDETGLSGLEESIPTDLPPIIAEQRLNLIDRFPKPENLQAKLELSEILVANLYGEPVNENLFSPGSLKSALWHDIADQISARECAILIDEETRFIESINNPDSEKSRFALAARQQSLAELHHLADRCDHHEQRRARLAEQEAQAAHQDFDDEPRPIAPGL